MPEGEGNEGNPDEGQNKVKPVEQVIHKLSVTVVSAQIFRDEKDFQKVYYKPLNVNDPLVKKPTEEEREQRIRKKEIKMHSYVKVFFGTEKERANNMKYIKIQEKKQKEEKARREQEIKEIYERTHISSTLKTSLNYSNVLNQSMVREQKMLSEQQPQEGEEGQEPQQGENQADENPFVKQTQVNTEGHLEPSWGETFEFERTTENYFTVVLYEVDQNKEFYKKRQWLRERYQGDQVYGQAKVDFSSVVKRQRDVEKFDKVVKLKNNDGEEVGEITVSIEYKDAKKPKNYDELKEKAKTLNHWAMKFSGLAPTMTADLSKFGTMVSYCVIRINQDKRITGNAAAGQFGWDDTLEFNEVDLNQKKIYFEIVVLDEQTKFKEAVGIGSVDLKDMPEGEGQTMEKPVKLSYKGKPSGTLSFTYDKIDRSSLTLKKKQEPVDFKTIKPSEKMLQVQTQLEQRKEQMSQKFYKFQAPHPITYSTPQYKPQQQSYQNTKKKNWEGNLNEPFKLPKLKMKDGTYKEPLHSVMDIKYVDDPVYHNQITGTGFSRWNSATTLRVSVPQFSIGRSDRFEKIDPQKLPPGPGEYGKIGILEKMEKLDKKLETRRKKHYDEFKALNQQEGKL